MQVKSYCFIVLGVFTLSVATFSSCDQSLGFHNKPPDDPKISIGKCFVGAGGDVELYCSAPDPDDDPVTVLWEAEYGEFYPESGEGFSVVWIAPDEPGIYTVKVTATDRLDESTSSAEIEVGEALPVISGITELSDNGSFYMIDSPQPVFVGSSATLRIHAGVTVVIDQEEGGLNVFGRLEVVGTAGSPVIFKPNICPGEDGVWRGILFDGPDASGSILNANITMAVRGISVEDGANVVLDSIFVHDGVGIGVNVEESEISVEDCRVSDNAGGIHILDADAEITNCEIRDNSGYGIWIEIDEDGSGDIYDVAIEGCTIATNVGDGIKISYYALPVINYNSIYLNDKASGGYDIMLFQYFNDSGIDARYNFWGVTNESDIQERIYDGFDFLPPQPDIYVDYSGWLMSQP
ncbi:MAG: right-handed parallel beta-helix repeat-containing protein [Candidatus Krumholzibacteriota bacterium]|nr:right-handed parallel beta-helix repeat-containing protein [Candidatus Krumholzibacteriota bacterium]